MAADDGESSRDTRPFLDPLEQTDAGDVHRKGSGGDSGHPLAAAPTRIGPYQIIAILGQGGMGVVYRAEQLQPIQRAVALKVIRGRSASPTLRQRFEVERRLLARLDHPSIAKVYEAGDTPDGDPYFAMELIEGPTLAETADAHTLGIEQRVRLVVAVARAIHHAHQKGILHRDIKPSNVLVAEVDGVLIPKIIDFGISMLLDDQAAPGTGRADRGAILGSPAYLAPEALILDDEDSHVDIRSDVYSLGILLYELLIGERPFGRSGGTLLDLITQVQQGTVEAPSARVTTGAIAVLAERARLRGETPRSLPRKLRPDLDAITRKATNRAPEARYQSALELVDELERYLAGNPVAAVRPTRAYRLSRFARRHRAALGTLALVVAALVAGLVLAMREAHRARLAESQTRAVVDFLVGMFEVSDPSQSRGETITARELLDAGGRRAEAALASQPLVGARLLDTIGRVREQLGLWPAAEESARQALEIRRRELGPRAIEVAESLELLGKVHLQTGAYEEADAALREALAIREERQGLDAPERALTLDRLGHLHSIRGFYPEAIDLHRQALAILDAHGANSDPRTAEVLEHLAITLFDDGQVVESGPLFERSRIIRESLLGPDHPRTISSLQGEAMVAASLDETERAIALYEDVLERRERVLGVDHPDVAQVLNNLAASLPVPEGLTRSRALLERSAAIWEKALGPDAPRRGISLYNLGDACRSLGDKAAAQANFEESARILAAAYGATHPRVAYPLAALGQLAQARGDLSTAEDFFRRALTIRRAALRPTDQNLAESALQLADVLAASGQLSEAQALRDEFPPDPEAESETEPEVAPEAQ